MARTIPALRVAFATLCFLASGLRFSTTATPQQVTFRSGVDLVAVDTQVIDKDGQPISNLAANNFAVWINGQERKVVSADLIQFPLQVPRKLIDSPAESQGGIERSDLPAVTGRVIVIAVDEVSFSIQAMPAVLQATKRFLDTLSPEDVVAAYPYPFGNGRLDLTHFHNQVGLQLNHVQGVRPPTLGGGDLYLSASEAGDIASNDSFALQAAYERECLISQGKNGCIDKDDGRVPTGGQGSCSRRLKAQANERAAYMESLAADSFSGLRSLLEQLKVLSGPKTVVLVSAGLMASDRAGGRPDVTGIMTAAGQLASAANATVYVLHFDSSLLETYSANGARDTYNPCMQSVSNAFTSQSRDEQLNAVGLQRIAGQASGEYFRILGGNGDLFFNRVLKETSAYYVLGVLPEDADRDGRMHFIRVKTVDVKNATVRSRAQVTIPKNDSGK